MSKSGVEDKLPQPGKNIPADQYIYHVNATELNAIKKAADTLYDDLNIYEFIPSDLNAVIAAIGTTKTTLIITTTTTLTNNLTIPGNVTLEFRGGQIIGAYTLSIYGKIQAGFTQIFNSNVIVKNYSGQPYEIKWFGAIGNGTTSDQVSVQQWINTLNNSGGNLAASAGTYLITGISIPKVYGFSTPVNIIGFGASFYSTTNAAMFDGLPTDDTEAQTLAGRRFNIQGIRFIGDNGNQQIGFRLSCTYGSIIQDCTFFNCWIGLSLVFCLKAKVINCFSSNGYRNFSVTSGIGLWTGATQNNSQSNCTIIDSCDSGMQTGSHSGYYFNACSECVIKNCIGEGYSSPDYIVYFDYGGANTVKSFTIDGLHLETTEVQKANIYCNVSGGVTDLRNLFPQYNGVLIEGYGGIFNIENLAYLPGSVQFKTLQTGSEFYFNQFYPTSFDFYDPANWVILDGNGDPVSQAIAAKVVTRDRSNITSRIIQGGTNIELKADIYATVTAGNTFTINAGVTTMNGYLRLHKMNGNQIATGLTTLHTVIGKVAIRDENGSISGYVPLYDSIT